MRDTKPGGVLDAGTGTSSASKLVVVGGLTPRRSRAAPSSLPALPGNFQDPARVRLRRHQNLSGTFGVREAHGPQSHEFEFSVSLDV